MSAETENNTIAYESLPGPVQDMLKRMRNNLGATIGNLEVRQADEIYYESRRVINLPGTVSPSRTVDFQIITTPGEGEIAGRTQDRTDWPRPAQSSRQTSHTRHVMHEIIPSANPDAETISIDSLPAEVRGYIVNLFGKTTLSMTVAGQLLEIGKTVVYYGGKKVITESAATGISFNDLPQGPRQIILDSIRTGNMAVEMVDGGRLVVAVTDGVVTASYNKLIISDIPQ